MTEAGGRGLDPQGRSPPVGTAQLRRGWRPHTEGCPARALAQACSVSTLAGRDPGGPPGCGRETRSQTRGAPAPGLREATGLGQAGQPGVGPGPGTAALLQHLSAPRHWLTTAAGSEHRAGPRRAGIHRPSDTRTEHEPGTDSWTEPAGCSTDRTWAVSKAPGEAAGALHKLLGLSGHPPRPQDVAFFPHSSQSRDSSERCHSVENCTWLTVCVTGSCLYSVFSLGKKTHQKTPTAVTSGD